MIVFFDASAVVKWFLEDERSAEVEDLRRGVTGAVSHLTEVELASAFCRRHREGSISAETLEELLAASADQLESLLVIELSQPVLSRARTLLLRHPLRAADAVQLASCLELQDRLGQPILFLAFDQRLDEAAGREGLRSPL